MNLVPERFTINDYLHHSFQCSCGKIHHTDVQKVLIAPGAMKEVPQLVKELGYHHVFMVCDTNTFQAAGEELEKLLTEGEVPCTLHRISQDPVVPDERTLGDVMMHFDHECDVILAVGTGTINDLCKFLSFQMGKPYFVCATAPSVDGFASVGAALITDNLKITYDAHVPQVIIGDVDVLAKAPMAMIAAGVADILGKYTCLCDWHLSHIINGEYFCPVIEQMVRLALKKMIGQVDHLKDRNPQVIQSVMEALVLTGIAMSFVGNSRPASGCEHHISHYWEMKFLFDGRPAVLHGTKVGIGTVMASRMYHSFIKKNMDYQYAAQKADTFDFEAWKKEMHRTFTCATDGVIALEEKEKKNDPAIVKERLKVIEAHMDEIKEMIRELVPEPEVLEDILRNLEAPVSPAQLEIDRYMVRDSVMVAKEVRNRYTLLQLLWDLGILEEMAEEIADDYS